MLQLRNPYSSFAVAASEKKDKRLANRKLRRKLHQLPPDQEGLLPLKQTGEVLEIIYRAYRTFLFHCWSRADYDTHASYRFVEKGEPVEGG